ncbi:MAG: hypothetical protein FVQ83_03235 [Chloroflexi bacterium]|nr:hypothetical protein [Chloroflexota bacterium]
MKDGLKLFPRTYQRLKLFFVDLRNNWRLDQMTKQVSQKAPQTKSKQPVVFFNASTRMGKLSLNAAYSLLASWGLRLAGVQVVHFVCQAGMSRCVLGTKHYDHTIAPPCDRCMALSKRIFAQAETYGFSYQADADLENEINDLSIDALSVLEYQGQPLGKLALPSLRWALRMHHLIDDHATRFLMREYILSAHRVGQEFAAFLDRIDPVAIVVFNGAMFPEATARWIAKGRGLRVITHEASLQPYAAIFTTGEATAYPIEIPPDFELSEAQNARLDAYLMQRSQGKFTMAGIRFWPEMQNLEDAILTKIEQFEQLVPIFTNVIFDTSQVHANIIFPHMFAWLDQVLEIIKSHPETLFVIRAHPDELRPGKESRESVRQWVENNKVEHLPNAVFFDSQEYVSSYELIKRAKFAMVYNSSIGLEASIMGAVVLCGGKARYTSYPTVYFPQKSQDHRQRAEEFLTAESLEVPQEMGKNARRFLYYMLYIALLPLNDFIAPHPTPGYVKLKDFHVDQLTPNRSDVIKILNEGILNAKPFIFDEIND